MTERAAYHEAGHAVAMYVFHQPISGVSVEPNEDSVGRVGITSAMRAAKQADISLADALVYALICMSGSYAETLVAKRAEPRGDEGRSPSRPDGDEDSYIASTILEPYFGCTVTGQRHLVGYLDARTREFVRENAVAKAIKALAARLLTERSMTGRTAQQTISRAFEAADLQDIRARFSFK